MTDDKENIVGGKYQMIHFLDRGCFSSIYLGQNLLTREKVAIKVQNDHPEMLMHEASLLNHLRRHGCTDRIPIIYWFGQHQKQSCFVMNYYNVCLQDILFSSPGVLTRVEDLNELMTQMLLCIQNIHKAGVIHRDIKPKNFMMYLGDEMTENVPVHLIDYGMATAVMPTLEDEENADSTNLIGNFKYMSWFVEKRKSVASRRDDLISIGYIYVLAAIYLKMLPVQRENNGLFQNTDWKSRENIQKLLGSAVTYHEQWRSIYEYLDYCYDLSLVEMPKYYLLLKLFDEGR